MDGAARELGGIARGRVSTGNRSKVEVLWIFAFLAAVWVSGEEAALRLAPSDHCRRGSFMLDNAALGDPPVEACGARAVAVG